MPQDIQPGGTCRRLRDALAGLTSGAAGWHDVASLVRQVLLEEEARRGAQVPLVVPIGAVMPSREQWTRLGCTAVPEGAGLSISAAAWHPPIGPAESPAVAERDIYEVSRGPLSAQNRHFDRCPADPFWTTALGHQYYNSVGQRQAARTVALAPPGSTTIICLPTGHGKTDVVLAPAILASRDRGVSVIVVPTVVLALDMERRARNVLGRGVYAYTGALSDEAKKQVREDVRDGRQRVLFTSPEALVTGLSDALAAAAEAGHLQYFVIDEAHLVEQWGNEFRPEFQTMASQRLTWLSLSPPGRQVATIAMSATLTERQITTLTGLFAGDEQPAALVWASALRREPSYYTLRCAGDDQRRDALLEAVGRLPRPMALYTTKVADAKAWVARLRHAGFRRVTQVTGDSTETERRAALEGWGGAGADTRYDIVVGTSAFGLGVDMADVRSVLHACVPETVDRFYQEVGRGGRDGHPSISFLATAPSDDALADSVNSQTLISAVRGWERWTSMRDSATVISQDVIAIDLDARPADMGEGFGRNQQWNVRTLNLMVRAGLIKLLAPEPPRREDTESDASWTARGDAFYDRIATRIDLRIEDGRTNREEFWSQAVLKQRTSLLAEQKSALRHMRELLQGQRCAGEILAGYYRTAWRGGLLTTGVTCRGCPHCRAHGRADTRGVQPNPAVCSWPESIRDPLSELRGGSAWLSLWWHDDQERAVLVPQLLERLARRGVSVLGGPGLDARTVTKVQAAALPAAVIVDHDEDLVTRYPGPLVWVLDGEAGLDGAVADRLDSSDPTYVIHPDSLCMSDRPSGRVIDVHSFNLSVKTTLGVL